MYYIPVRHDILCQANGYPVKNVTRVSNQSSSITGEFFDWSSNFFGGVLSGKKQGGPRAGSTWSSARGSGPTLPQTSGFIP